MYNILVLGMNGMSIVGVWDIGSGNKYEYLLE